MGFSPEPKHRVSDVARRLAKGFADHSIVLSKTERNPVISVYFDDQALGDEDDVKLLFLEYISDTYAAGTDSHLEIADAQTIGV